MARGWESKSVEAQMESAERLKKPPAGTSLSPEQIADERKRDGLLLHRTRVLRDIGNCHDARYRKTLSDGLKYLEQQLVELGWKMPDSGPAPTRELRS